MDRVAAMLILLGVLVSLVLMILALFAVAPIFCSCLISLLYTLYLFVVNEEHGVHHAQESENRFWTIFAVLFSTALFFAKDSPIAFGRWSPSLGFTSVLVAGYAMHTWDRHVHRIAISRQLTGLRRNAGGGSGGNLASSSLTRLNDLGIPVESHLERIHASLADIDQLLIPSTINNFINQRFVMTKEREIIRIFADCDARALNYLVAHVKLGLVFYKVKDHRNFSGQHRTELIQLLCADRLPVLTVMSRVIVLHALQLMKLRANPRAEYWVRNVILNTHQDDLSELKTLTDAKGDYFCMNKLIYDDIKSETVRQDILAHIRKEAAIQQAHMQMGTKRAKRRSHLAWRKVLSDVDDTLSCSGGSYPAGIDKRYGKKVVYPGVLAFYREMDLGTQGPEEWPENRVGNLVFLSARPHVYKDVSEKVNFKKFEKLRVAYDGRKGMHTVPSLLAGDIASGTEYMMKNDLEPLALKKYDNFKRYVSIYPEFSHVFIGDNGQGDVRAGELMYDNFPYEFEALYVHLVQDAPRTFGYDLDRWRQKGLAPFFFRTYPEAALHAVQRSPPQIRINGLRRVCCEAAKDFQSLKANQWPSSKHKIERRAELNQSLWRANQFLRIHQVEPVPLIHAEQRWQDGQKVRTPFGIAKILSFDSQNDLYHVELDWRPLNVQVAEHKMEERDKPTKQKQQKQQQQQQQQAGKRSEILETVVEHDDEEDHAADDRDNNNDDDDDDDDEAEEMDENDDSTGFNEVGIPKVVKVVNVRDPRRSQSQPSSSLASSSEENGEKFSQSTEALTQEADGVESVNTQSTPDDTDGSIDGDGGRGEVPPPPPPLSSSSAREPPGTKIVGEPPPAMTFVVKATIHSRNIKPYSAPVLPKFAKDRGGSLFSFFSPHTTTAANNPNSTEPTSKTKKPSLKVGDKCSTPYGLAVIVEYRDNRQQQQQQFVVVDMIGWTARAYLAEKDVKPIPTSLLGSLLRQFSVSEQGGGSKAATAEFPYAIGTVIKTPYGDATVEKPLPPPSSSSTKLEPLKSSGRSVSSTSSRKTVPSSLPPQQPQAQPQSQPQQQQQQSATPQQQPQTLQPSTSTTTASAAVQPTLGLRLTGWTLADESHPMLYCTVETARKWKEDKGGGGGSSTTNMDGLLSAFGNLVSKTFRSTTTRSDKVKSGGNATTSGPPAPLHKQYYKDGAAVATNYGAGAVRRFRPADGFYEVSLVSWKLANGVHPTVYLKESDVRYRIAQGCHEGYPVLTKLGLSGILASVEPTTGVHIVTVPSAGMVCYLQPECIVGPLKAAVGEDVLTPYGDGKVERYDAVHDTYVIRLHGWGARLYANAETLDRVGMMMMMQDRDGHPFFGGMNWLLRLLFFASSSSTTTRGSATASDAGGATNNSKPGTRSRSNSLLSSTGGGRSTRSVT